MFARASYARNAKLLPTSMGVLMYNPCVLALTVASFVFALVGEMHSTYSHHRHASQIIRDLGELAENDLKAGLLHKYVKSRSASGGDNKRYIVFCWGRHTGTEANAKNQFLGFNHMLGFRDTMPNPQGERDAVQAGEAGFGPFLRSIMELGQAQTTMSTFVTELGRTIKTGALQLDGAEPYLSQQNTALCVEGSGCSCPPGSGGTCLLLRRPVVVGNANELDKFLPMPENRPDMGRGEAALCAGVWTEAGRAFCGSASRANMDPRHPRHFPRDGSLGNVGRVESALLQMLQTVLQSSQDRVVYATLFGHGSFQHTVFNCVIDWSSLLRDAYRRGDLEGARVNRLVQLLKSRPGNDQLAVLGLEMQTSEGGDIVAYLPDFVGIAYPGVTRRSELFGWPLLVLVTSVTYAVSLAVMFFLAHWKNGYDQRERRAGAEDQNAVEMRAVGGSIAGDAVPLQTYRHHCSIA